MEGWVLKTSVMVLALLASGAQAEGPPDGFPDGAQPLTAEAISAAVTDRMFKVQPAQGSPWRIEFKAGGHYFVNIGRFSDNGPWRAEDGRLCTEGRQIKAACNELRAREGVLYMRRESGEVVRFDQP